MFFKSILRKWWRRIEIQSCRYLSLKFSSPFFMKTNLKGWRRQWHPNPVLLPGKSHGWRSLVGCSPWGGEELNTTERLHFSLSYIREGNGNPLQCSCLENPRDGRAWWAAIYGITQSRTRLKWLSSSSSSSVLSMKTDLWLVLNKYWLLLLTFAWLLLYLNRLLIH